MSWSKVCPATLSAGECKGVQVGDVRVAVFNVEGRFHATSNVCTHQFALLSEGYLEDGYIECPLHQGRFNVVTGEAEGPPVEAPLRVFPIKVEDGDVYVDVDSAEGSAPV